MKRDGDIEHTLEEDDGEVGQIDDTGDATNTDAAEEVVVAMGREGLTSKLNCLRYSELIGCRPFVENGKLRDNPT